MRHNRSCDWIVEPGLQYCPQCYGAVILEEEVPDVTDALGAAPETAPALDAIDESQQPVATLTCPTCGRVVTPAGEGLCPWDGTPLRARTATSAADASTRVTVTTANGHSTPLGDAPLVLGRLSEDTGLATAVDADGVSRRHARLRRDGNGVVWLSDLGSTNGTWLAGKQLKVEARLPPGDSVVGLGKDVTVIVHVP